METLDEACMDENRWYLRTDDDKIYGPADQRTLIQWAENGSILPVHKVSHDRVNWFAASSIPFLEMTYYVRMPDGRRCGPLNLKMINVMKSQGKIPSEAEVFRIDAEGNPIQDTVQSEESEETQEGNETIADEKMEPVVEDAGLKKEVETLQARCVLLEEELASCRAAQEDSGKHQKNELDRMTQHLADALAKVQSLEQEKEVLKTEKERISELLVRSEHVASDRAEQVRKQEELLRAQEEKVSELSGKEAAQRRETEEIRQQLEERNAELAAVMAESNARDETYQKQIEELQKNASLPPEEIERYYACRDAVYGLIRMEVDQLETALEEERTSLETLKKVSKSRIEMMTEHRLALARQLGAGPEEMARRSLREQPADFQSTRLRAELENLKVTSEREVAQVEEREQETLRKLRMVESELARCKDAASEAERLRFRIQDVQGTLAEREKELAEVRRRREMDQKAADETCRALTNRIEQLENPEAAAQQEERDSTPYTMPEPRHNRLSGWLHLK